MKILAIYGTRPEFLKVKPVINASKGKIKSCFIKQHTDIINFGKSDFSIEIDQTCKNRLNNIFSQIFIKAENIICDFDAVLIQGDTATVAASALVAYHLKKKIIYLESGLRTYDLENPYPEEGYRQMVSRIADINLCPTKLSAKNLKKEKTNGSIYVVGNTGLDNLIEFKNKTCYGDKVLITLHRNENLSILKEWFAVIDEFAKNNTNIKFIFPVHPNPYILEQSKTLKYIQTISALQHDELINILKDCRFIITDSGGIQEEGSFLNKKIIACRKTTERPEGINSGHIMLCESPSKFNEIADIVKSSYIIQSKCPYGNGKSSSKILKLLNNENI